MRILALDLATKTGWATWDGARMESGVQDFSKKRGESNGMLFWHFNVWMEMMVWPAGAKTLDLIVWEQAHHRGGAATEIGVGLGTRAMEFAARANCEHASVHSATLKKWATGSGKASKEEMVLAAREYKWPEEDAASRWWLDDNEADAILLLQYAIKELVGETACSVPSATPKCELPTRSILQPQ